MMHPLKNILAVLLGLILVNESAFACATCYGESNSNLAVGMNYGILALVVVAYFVLFGIVAFFGYLMYRSHRMAAQLEAEASSETDESQP